MLSSTKFTAHINYPFLLILIILCIPARGQIKVQNTGDSCTTITVIPGAEYHRGKFTQLFLGAHWRDLWTTPVTVPVLNFKQFAGGLTPIKRGGGFQTKSLHFKGENGKYYKFRSINKDPSKVLPDELRESLVADIIKDQISTSHPLAAIIVAPLLNAVGVLNAEPTITYLPDSEFLGEFRDEFKNLLGTIEENPKDDTDPAQIFAGADKVVNEYEIFEELEEDNDDQIDQPEYLKARLMDVYLGDWDRHVGQWKWARYKTNGKKIWKPIPRDRDQAFCRYDGLFPWIAALSIPQVEGFSGTYPQVNDITWSGRHLDRRFLTGISKTTWDSVTNFVIQHLTDQVIENAVLKLPPEWYKKSGPGLIQMLKKRRDALNKISYQYYRMISKYVSVWFSNKPEFAEINRLDDHLVEIAVFKKDKNSEAKKGNPIFYRIFDGRETRDIRLYLQGGADRAIVRGTVNNSIPVRIIGGSGEDQLIDSSMVKGYFLCALPIPDSENETRFYDSDSSTIFVKGPGTTIDRSSYPPPQTFDTEEEANQAKYAPTVRDWGHDWKRGFKLDYSSDDGLLLSGGIILYEFAFRVKPYQYRMELLGGYATGVKSYHIDYTGEFYSLIRGLRILFHTRRTQLDYNRFYGLGNETSVDKELNDRNYYRVAQELNRFSVTFEKKIGGWMRSALDLGLRNSQLKNKQNTILSDPGFTTLRGIDELTAIDISSRIIFDTNEKFGNIRNKLFINCTVSTTPYSDTDKSAYIKSNFDFRSYLRLNKSTIACRLFGEKAWGDYLFFDAVKLGGKEILRGFGRERFTGDAALFSALEFRQPLFKSTVLIPAQIGLTAFTETGRIFYRGESSNRWHPCYGGGAWISYLNDKILLSTSLAKSAEGLSFYLSNGFMF